jgi:hypothetical protein
MPAHPQSRHAEDQERHAEQEADRERPTAVDQRAGEDDEAEP